MFYPFHFFRRLETPVNKHGALSKRYSALTVKSVQSSEMERCTHDEGDDENVKREVGAKTASVGWRFFGRVQKGTDDVTGGGTDEDER